MNSADNSYPPYQANTLSFMAAFVRRFLRGANAGECLTRERMKTRRLKPRENANPLVGHRAMIQVTTGAFAGLLRPGSDASARLMPVRHQGRDAKVAGRRTCWHGRRDVRLLNHHTITQPRPRFPKRGLSVGWGANVCFWPIRTSGTALTHLSPRPSET